VRGMKDAENSVAQSSSNISFAGTFGAAELLQRISAYSVYGERGFALASVNFCGYTNVLVGPNVFYLSYICYKVSAKVSEENQGCR